MAYIVVDGDGTVFTHDYPEIGKDIGAAPVLRKLIENKHKIILFTMRSDKEDIKKSIAGRTDFLTQAVEWFEKNKIPLFGIQTNPTQKNWTSSPKAYGQLIIDDAALGCPIKTDLSISDRPFIDWVKAEEMLIKMGYIK